jgi:hypothetical protein
MAAVAAKAAATERAGVTAGNFLVTIIKIGGNRSGAPYFFATAILLRLACSHPALSLI